MPLFLLSFLGGVKSVFSAILTFCSKPPGSYLAIVVIAGLGLWWYGQHEFNAGVAKDNAAHVVASAKEVARQTTVTTAVVAKSETTTTAAVIADKINRGIVTHVKQTAAALPPPPVECPASVPAGFADQLRAIN